MQRFRSKIDGTLAALGLALPLATGGVMLLMGATVGGPPWWSALPLLLTALLFVWILLSTWYAFEGTSLLVRSGPFVWRVPLEQICSVQESSSIRSGPALSMDRLELRFGDDRVMLISPKDKAGFWLALRHHVPALPAAGALRQQ